MGRRRPVGQATDLAVSFACYNFCRVRTVLNTTPAVAAGLADEPCCVNEAPGRAGTV
jgi:hypothetical protein